MILLQRLIICKLKYHVMQGILHLTDVLTFFPNKPWFLHVCSRSLFKNTVEKEKIVRNEQFLLFPKCFLPVWRILCHFLLNLELSSAKSFILEESKICLLERLNISNLTFSEAFLAKYLLEF